MKYYISFKRPTLIRPTLIRTTLKRPTLTEDKWVKKSVKEWFCGHDPLFSDVNWYLNTIKQNFRSVSYTQKS